jgi:hypothetical protein
MLFMVDLSRTEEQFLAEIHSNSARAALENNAQAGLERPALDAPWQLVGRTPGELFPLLTKTFSAFYAEVSDSHVSRDLIDPVKKGLGNAYKWGNKRDHEKQLVVTAVMTRVGAVIKITDEGQGFDVPRVVRDGSFTHGGSGLTRFHKTSSVISYADGGRTLLIRFLCDAEAERSSEQAIVQATRRPSAISIDLIHLIPGGQVKVKGVLNRNGTLLARKVTLKPSEDLAVIEAPLQQVQDNGRAIRLLDLNVTLSEQTEIIDADLTPVGFDRLRAGEVVWLTGKYAAGEGLTPVRIKIRRGRNGETSEVQGTIEAINHADKTFRVVGITVVTDDHTEVRAIAAAP